MPELLTRSVPLDDFEVRADAREISGVIVPFNTRTQIGHFTETFEPGSFTRTIAERGTRVKLLFGHDTNRPLGRAVTLTEERRGLVGTFKVARTIAGDEAIELVRSGAFDSFSVGFTPITDRWSRNRDHVDRLEVKLLETSLVTLPAYETARIESVRSRPVYRPELDPYVQRVRLALDLH